MATKFKYGLLIGLSIILAIFMPSVISCQEYNQDTVIFIGPDITAIVKSKKDIKKGDYFFRKEKYQLALENYFKAYPHNLNSVELNLNIGVSYLYSQSKQNCLVYFQRVYTLDSTYDWGIHFYLAVGYHLNYKFEEAIKHYKYYINTVATKRLALWKPIVDKRIEECYNGIEICKKPRNMQISNLGKTINSDYAEIRPFYDEHDSMLYFTSFRKPKTVKAKYTEDGSYYPDIYQANFTGGKWENSKSLDYTVNTLYSDEIASISHDGSKMIIYRNHGYDGNLFVSEKHNRVWGEPVAFEPGVNTKYEESSACFSVTTDSLFFVSDRPDLSVGRKDIFFCYKTDGGKWSMPISVSNQINTVYNEDCVYVTPNGKRMYFCSMGHSSLGGYDIFMSVRDSLGEWAKPINLGYPVNSPDDEKYFSISSDEKYAYFASSRAKGFSDHDIYRVELNNEIDQLALGTYTPIKTIVQPIQTNEKLLVYQPATSEPDTVQYAEPYGAETDTLNDISGPLVLGPDTIREFAPNLTLGKADKVLRDLFLVDLNPTISTIDHEKNMLNKAKAITMDYLAKNASSPLLGQLQNKGQTVLIEIEDLSGNKEMDIFYTSGTEGNFVLILPENLSDEITLEQKDLGVTYGKYTLVSSEVTGKLIENSIIPITAETNNGPDGDLQTKVTP